MLRWLRNRLHAEPLDVRVGGGVSGEGKAHAHGKFRLEPLEPRVLLSGDTPLVSEVYRSLLEDEANGVSAAGNVNVEQIDAATSAQITAAGGGDCCGAQAETIPSVAWPESWQPTAAGESASSADPAAIDDLRAGLPAPEIADEQSSAIALFDRATATSGAPEDPDADDSLLGASSDQDFFASTIPVSELPRGPPGDDQTSSALIATESITIDELSLSDSPEGDERGLFGVQQLLVSDSFDDGLPRGPPAADPLTDQALAPILEQALRLWTASGLAGDITGRLANLKVRIADLPGGELGEADANFISLDATAAGRGWFVDSTPDESSEFSVTLPDSRSAANAESPAFGRIDLLTVLLHETGHVLGFGHDSGLAVMAENLNHSQRALLGGSTVSSVTTMGEVVADASTVPPTLDLSDAANNAATITIQVNTDGTLDIVGTMTSDDGTSVGGITNIIGNSAAAITLVSPKLDNIWKLTGINAGTLKAGGLSTISFTDIQNLTGSSTASNDKDTFVFSGGAVTGSIADGTGTLDIQLLDFFYLSGDFNFTTEHGNLVLNNGTWFNGVDYQLLCGTGVSAFVGNGPDTDPAAFGLSLAGIDFSLLLFTDTSNDISYTALKTSCGTASFTGLSDLVLEAWAFNVELNQTSDGANSDRVLDFRNGPSDAVDGIPVTPVGLPVKPTIDFEGENGSLLGVTGNAVVDAFGSVVAKGDFTIALGQVSGNDVGTAPVVSFTDADAVSLTLSGITVFAGVGGSLDNNST
ncbi:MAG: LEPR-XLL domain-containing protein, partial [Pseudomonadota bacterium]